MTLHSLAITKTVQGHVFTMDPCRNKASVFLKTGSEIQLHFAESKPGQVDANGKPGDGADDGPQLEGTLNGIGKDQIDAVVMEILIQLHTLQKFGAKTDSQTHNGGMEAGDQNEEAKQSQNHALSPENQRHQQAGRAGHQHNTVQTVEQKVTELLGVQVDAHEYGQTAQNTKGNGQVRQHHERDLDQLGHDHLQTGNTQAQSHLNGLGTEVKGEALNEVDEANR